MSFDTVGSNIGHPNARSYRTKSIPYYWDLCQIYKDTSSEANAVNSDKNMMKSLPESVDEDDPFENNNADLEYQSLRNLMVVMHLIARVFRVLCSKSVYGVKRVVLFSPTPPHLANSDARQYMTRPVPYYKDLCTIKKEMVN
ncbi:hypothetical protein R6Q57_017351 [Mikania cordata]